MSHSPTGNHVSDQQVRHSGEPSTRLVEERVNEPRKVVLAVVFVILAAGFSTASDIYIAQNAAGANTGADCADAHAAAWFNSASNWGSNAGQIGPGTTVHACGTFNEPAGASCTLTFQGSGSSGNPITLLFEPNALATATYWGANGFICGSGNNYIVVDGGTNGTIQATANGSSLANHVAGSGMNMDGSSNSEVKNLTLSNLFVPVANNSNNNINVYGIHWVYGNSNQIDHNTLHDCRWCIYFAYRGSATTSNIEIDHNTVYNCDHGIAVGDGNTNAILSGTNLIHDNVIHDFVLWDAPGDTDHHDAIHIWAVHSGSKINDIKVYNNYEYGDPGTSMSAYDFIDAESGGAITIEIFNELIVNTSSTNAPGDGFIYFYISPITAQVYNNTLVGVNTSINTGIGTLSSGVIAKNNIISTMNLGLYMQGSGTFSASDYNDFYNLTNVAGINGGSYYATLASWKASAGSPDAHSINSNPNLSGSYLLQTGSLAIGAATNRTSLGITALDSDHTGTARPSSGAWDAGAYQDQAGISPPTGLTVAVN